MEKKFEIDLRGEIYFDKDSKLIKPLPGEFWGHANIKGATRSDSFLVYLVNKDKLNPGESCPAEFRFKFRDDERFKIELTEGQIIELKWGSVTIAEFKVHEIVNREILK